MSLPPLPQFTNEYQGEKLRYLVQVLENFFQGYTQNFVDTVPYIQSLYTPVGNVGITETTLFSGTISTFYMPSDGGQILMQAFGTFASNANTKELKVYINNTVIYDSGAIAANGGSWNIQATIIRSGDAAQQNMVVIISSNALLGSSAVYSATTVDFTQNATFSVTYIGQANNDILGQGMILTAQYIS